MRFPTELSPSSQLQLPLVPLDLQRGHLAVGGGDGRPAARHHPLLLPLRQGHLLRQGERPPRPRRPRPRPREGGRHRRQGQGVLQVEGRAKLPLREERGSRKVPQEEPRLERRRWVRKEFTLKNSNY